MIVISEPSQITDPDIRQLVEQRWTELDAPVGAMFIVEVGDSVDELEALTGCPIVNNLFDDARFGSEDFVASFEALEDHGSFYEMVFILGDDGGIELLIPKAMGIDAELLALCGEYL